MTYAWHSDCLCSAFNRVVSFGGRQEPRRILGNTRLPSSGILAMMGLQGLQCPQVLVSPPQHPLRSS